MYLPVVNRDMNQCSSSSFLEFHYNNKLYQVSQQWVRSCFSLLFFSFLNFASINLNLPVQYSSIYTVIHLVSLFVRSSFTYFNVSL